MKKGKCWKCGEVKPGSKTPRGEWECDDCTEEMRLKAFERAYGPTEKLEKD